MTTNFLWCVSLNIRNKSGGEYFGRSAISAGGHGRESVAEMSATEAVEPWNPNSSAGGGAVTAAAVQAPVSRARPLPLAANYAFAALAGIIWYL